MPVTVLQRCLVNLTSSVIVTETEGPITEVGGLWTANDAESTGAPSSKRAESSGVAGCSRDKNSVPWDETGGSSRTASAKHVDRGTYERDDGYGDCFSYPLAKATGLPLLFKGRETTSRRRTSPRRSDGRPVLDHRQLQPRPRPGERR